MANQWLRLWHDMPNDPKWRTIARASKQPIPCVIAVYLHILVIASNASERGRTQKMCSEDIASALDMDTEQIDAILEAMQGRVLDGDRVAGWDARQPAREDGSAERSKAWRDAKKSVGERTRTQPNASDLQEEDTDKDSDTDKEQPKEEIAGDQASLATQAPNVSSPANRSIEIAVYLRQRGIVGANSPNPNISGWGDDARVTNEILDAGLSIVASRIASGALERMPGPNYLAPIIADLITPKSADPPKGRPAKFDPVAFVNRNRPSQSNERTDNVIDVEAKQVA